MVDQRAPLGKAGSPIKGERNRPTNTSGAEIKPEWKRGRQGTFREVRLTLETSEGSPKTLVCEGLEVVVVTTFLLLLL